MYCELMLKPAYGVGLTLDKEGRQRTLCFRLLRVAQTCTYPSQLQWLQQVFDGTHGLYTSFIVPFVYL